ncbi:Zn-dependent hydrolase [Oscillatoria sp. FACHB-1407]|uniref:Zn-dependent hydrolase n=1 Tax=Oscillatoria sp. FACHB-1407 TaxID=2692847 RepID=UPI0016892945|nr:Zn-dependent hydrolase [Oscillatoria sp. FACHB-1407]MBD2460560.1 Zn-dependent hydrolase [Oscillatoria sp. FACHB-1407]
MTTATLPKLSVNGDRLNDSIDRLAEIGKQPSGSICRLAFTSEDLQARYFVQQWMVEAGMTVHIDAAGNLIGTYAGLHNAPALATGSHIDTVPSGGRFDGVLGVLAGIEVVRTLKENNLRLNHPIQVIIFTDEEKTMIGCQAIAGTALLQSSDRYQPAIGNSIQTCLKTLGGNWDALATAQRSRSDIAAFVELHVEQGAVLERLGTDIGVVQGVVGMHRQSITVFGQANHAGTTPMDMRQDALVAAAKIVLAVQEIARQMPSQPVATVGYLDVSPNAVNIVPGQVELSVDMRDLSHTCLTEMMHQLQQQIEAIATETNTTIQITPLLEVEPTLAAPHVQGAIETVCQNLNLSYCHLPSRAGHDAMELGRITDMGMIFVPSQSGVSHSEAEYTSPEQCTQGANVLLHTLLMLDGLYEC